MYNFLLFTFPLILFCFILVPVNDVFAGYDDRIINPILDPAESFFISLRDGNYDYTWILLSEKSRMSIIDAVYKSSREKGVMITREDIVKNFDAGGIIFINYWTAVRNNFNPDMALKDSKWGMGDIKNNRAEIIIKYKTADRPTRLKMFKEHDTWKVGFIETFGTGKGVTFPEHLINNNY